MQTGDFLFAAAHSPGWITGDLAFYRIARRHLLAKITFLYGCEKLLFNILAISNHP
jgi:hypothetical protein